MTDRESGQSGREDELNENMWANGEQEEEGVMRLSCVRPAHLAQTAV